tara:strand:- start:47 stop:328 length:282 start_codon:yes stop_codon:yes gene_type:complete
MPKTKNPDNQDPSAIIKRMKDEARAETQKSRKLNPESKIGGKFTEPAGMTPAQRKRYQQKLKREEEKHVPVDKGEEYMKRHHIPADKQLPKMA